MTYYDRQHLLDNTLESFRQYDPTEFEIVIVDDNSPVDIVLSDYPFKITVIKLKEKPYVQNDPAWNMGLAHALKSNPDVIIIQNPECYHNGDILSYAKRVTDKSYIVFGCYSLGQGETVEIVRNDRCHYFDGDSGWYNHPVHNPRGLHFCSAITSKNLVKLNGFDERFSYGIGFDDDYLLHHVKCLGLEIEITAEPFVFHPWHYDSPGHPDKGELFERNKNLYNALVKENNYRAVHLLTPDFDE
jgi:glycosyltransferase involved in cell wall biosynthesis